MSWRAKQITKAIQNYDRELYAEYSHGRIDVFRKGFRHEVYDVDGITLLALRPDPYRVLCLTDTWNAWGRPVDWGVLPIMAKLESMDLWKRDIAKDCQEHNEKIEASERRAKRNEVEAFAKDFRKQFARIFEDVNTANMDNRADKRFKYDKRMKGI